MFETVFWPDCHNIWWPLRTAVKTRDKIVCIVAFFCKRKKITFSSLLLPKILMVLSIHVKLHWSTMPLIWSRDVSYLDRPKRLIYLFSWVLLRTISSSMHRSPNFKTRSANKSLISCVTKETVNRPVSSKKLSKCIYFLNLFFKIFFSWFFFCLKN